jgi:hypothetical protein
MITLMIVLGVVLAVTANAVSVNNKIKMGK